LRDFDAAPSASGKPWLVLGAEDDFLAPPAATRHLAQACGAMPAIRQIGGHGLPWTAPDFCAGLIADFLRRHEF
jgi:pimeloyl-ACP methyl ester carboxylesterase